MKKPRPSGRKNPGLHNKSKRFSPSGYMYQPSILQRRAVKPALPSPTNFYATEIAEFKERGDGWAWGCCPFHADRNPSFCMNLRTGWYECKSSNCGETGNSIVSFVSALHGLSTTDSIRYLEGLV
jgi:hypothetical protein